MFWRPMFGSTKELRCFDAAAPYPTCGSLAPPARSRAASASMTRAAAALRSVLWARASSTNSVVVSSPNSRHHGVTSGTGSVSAAGA